VGETHGLWADCENHIVTGGTGSTLSGKHTIVSNRAPGRVLDERRPSGRRDHGACPSAARRSGSGSARNYSSEEIARARDIGPATVKWHLGNLFGKLNVGGRRHAVRRARMLLLVVEDAAQ
jgi:DNA-binding CsgD family transcriptional regulator